MKAKILCITVALIILMEFAFANEFVVLIHSGVNIRTGANTSSIVIAEASKGELHRFIDESGDWYVIELFSGEQRYISKLLSARLKESQLLPGHHFALPSSEKIRKEMYGKILQAKERAHQEAEEIIPTMLDVERNQRYRKILEDRYILKVFQNYEVQPALYNNLIAEGAQKIGNEKPISPLPFNL